MRAHMCYRTVARRCRRTRLRSSCSYASCSCSSILTTSQAEFGEIGAGIGIGTFHAVTSSRPPYLTRIIGLNAIRILTALGVYDDIRAQAHETNTMEPMDVPDQHLSGNSVDHMHVWFKFVSGMPGHEVVSDVRTFAPLYAVPELIGTCCTVWCGGESHHRHASRNIPRCTRAAHRSRTGTLSQALHAPDAHHRRRNNSLPGRHDRDIRHRARRGWDQECCAPLRCRHRKRGSGS